MQPAALLSLKTTLMTLHSDHQPRPRRTHIFARAEREHYVEPVWASERLFQTENFGPRGARILDPACGWGRILRTAADAGYRVYGSDIRDTRRLDARDIPFVIRDFLKTNTLDRFTSVVCNPPFDAIEAFCRRALEIANYKVAMISPLPRLPAAHWLKELPLRRMWLLTPRPSIPPAHYLEGGKKAAGGRPEFCWLIFEHGWNAPPEFGWLHRDGGTP
jgi:hypothetical protein